MFDLQLHNGSKVHKTELIFPKDKVKLVKKPVQEVKDLDDGII